MPSVKCAKPQEWNSGAAIIVLSRALSGIIASSAADRVERLAAASATRPSACPSCPT